MTIDPITTDNVLNLDESNAAVTITGTVGEQWMDGEREMKCTCIGPVPLGDTKGSGNDHSQDKLGLRIPCRLMAADDLVLVDRSRVGSGSNPDKSDKKAMAPKIWAPDPKKKYKSGERMDGRVTIAPQDSAMRIDAQALQAMADDFSLSAVDLTQDIEVTMEVGRPVGRVEYSAEAACKDGSTLALKHPAQWTFSRDPSVLDAFSAPVSRVVVAVLSFGRIERIVVQQPAGVDYTYYTVYMDEADGGLAISLSVSFFSGPAHPVLSTAIAYSTRGAEMARIEFTPSFSEYGEIGVLRWAPASGLTFTPI